MDKLILEIIRYFATNADTDRIFQFYLPGGANKPFPPSTLITSQVVNWVLLIQSHTCMLVYLRRGLRVLLPVFQICVYVR